MIFEISNLQFVIKVFLTNTVNFGIGSAFFIGPGSAFSKGPLSEDPVSKVCHLIWYAFDKVCHLPPARGVFRTQSKIYNRVFLPK